MSLKISCITACFFLNDQNSNSIIIATIFLPLQILTKDSVTVSVDGVVYFRIQCPISAVANVSNAHSSTRLLAQTTLRNVLGTKNLAELLSDREGISLSMQVRITCAVMRFMGSRGAGEQREC